MSSKKDNITPLQIHEEENALVIIRPGARTTGKVLFVFACFWNIPLWLMMLNLRPDNTPEGYTPLGINLCMIPFLLAGIGLFAYALNELVNTTTYRVTSDSIEVTTAPIRFMNRKWQVKNITALDVHEYELNDTTQYDLRLVMRKGFPQPVLTQFTSRTQLEEIQQVVSDFLNISEQTFS